MSMTGQLFATRIAIGLAVPSPQALQKTGGMLAKGIQRIVAQAQAAGGGGTGVEGKYLQDLRTINSMTISSTKKMNEEMKALLKQNLSQMDQTAGSQIGKSFNRVKGQMGGLKAMMSKPLSQALGAGMEGLSGMSGVVQQTQNLYEMGAQNRQKVLSFASQRVELKEKEIDSLTTEANLQDTTTKKGLRKYNKLVKTADIKRKELVIDKEIHNNLKRQVTEAEKIEKIARNQVRLQEKISRAVLQTADTVRTKFNEALRTSVMILTAVGYKLSQNTQELIAFERELLNANSVFHLTNEELFKVGNTIIEFGNEFGIATQNGATGLYQLASAGLTANEALKVLPETLKLSMAVQGDHNTISKLTAQTLFGFGMEMDQAAIITDKFAFAIQKSLIEYQDLGSAVKFALPFFTSTGQSIDQLLGALQILTNRALEAGIAGRGLRQALAEFAESAMDAEAGFRKLGVEILNSQGEMLQLSEIAAQFAAAVGPETMNNTELLTTLIEELNVRGATAFIHLVQASDEFTQAVEDTANAGGQLDEMVRIQNQSLSAQIQILKTNVFSIFAFRDATYEGTEFINGFHEAVVNLVSAFKGLLIEGDGNEQQLTAFAKSIQDFAIGAVEGFEEVLQKLIIAGQDLMATGFFTAENFRLLTIPLRLMSDILEVMANTTFFNKSLFEFYMYWKAITMLGVPAMLSAMYSGMSGLAALSVGTAGATGATAAITSRFGAKAASGLAVGSLRLGSGLLLGATGLTALYGAYKVAEYVEKEGYANLPFFRGYDEAIAKRANGGPISPPPMMQQPRANGGPVSSGYPARANGGPVLVGEQGPELFMPGQAGQVLNSAETNNILGSDVIMRNVTIGVDSFGGIV